jgi:hypothetical protein
VDLHEGRGVWNCLQQVQGYCKVSAFKKGDWVTNTPRSIKGYWPRRDAVLVEGPPHATDTFTTEQLQEKRIVGIYLDEDIPEGIHSRKIIKHP